MSDFFNEIQALTKANKISDEEALRTAKRVISIQAKAGKDHADFHLIYPQEVWAALRREGFQVSPCSDGMNTWTRVSWS